VAHGLHERSAFEGPEFVSMGGHALDEVHLIHGLGAEFLRGSLLALGQHITQAFPVGDFDEGFEWQAGLSLLRAMRARLRHGVEFQLEPGVDSAGF